MLIIFSADATLQGVVRANMEGLFQVYLN